MNPERYLRLRAEDVIAKASAPPYELVEYLGLLGDIARSLAGAGLVEATTVQSVLVETEDALMVRGVSWVDPAVPDMPDLAALHEAASGSGRAELLRVLPIGTSLAPEEGPVSERTGSGERAPASRTAMGSGGAAPEEGRIVASLEIWSDRAVVRFADEVGAPGWWEFTPPPDPTERALVIQVAPGRTADVDLSRAADVHEVAVSRTRVEPLRYLERLALPRVGGDVRRVHAASSAFVDLGLIPVDGLEALAGLSQSAQAGLSQPAQAGGDTATGVRGWLLGVEPIAHRIAGTHGYVSSVERWDDHWRVVAPGASASAAALWSAVDDEGRLYGGAPLASGVIRFDPELPPDVGVTVNAFEAGWDTAIELFR